MDMTHYQVAIANGRGVARDLIDSLSHPSLAQRIIAVGVCLQELSEQPLVEQATEGFTDELHKGASASESPPGALPEIAIETAKKLDAALKPYPPSSYGVTVEALAQQYPEVGSALTVSYGLAVLDTSHALLPSEACVGLDLWFDHISKSHHALCAVRERHNVEHLQ